MADDDQSKSLATTVFEAFGQDVPPEYQDMKVEADNAAAEDQGTDQAQGEGRTRDESGRFAKAEDEGKAPDPEEEGKAEEAGKKEGEGEGDKAAETGADDSQATDQRPPPGWSPSSKAEWDKLPAAVKADIAKREQEVSDGFRQYAGLKDAVPYQDHYARQGSSVKQALDGYTAIDRALQKDFAGGLTYICEASKVNPVHAAYAILQRAGLEVPQQPQNGAQGADKDAGQGNGQPARPQPQQPMRDPRVDQIQQRLDRSDQERQRQEESQAEQTVAQFAADPKHPYFDNVKVTMGRLINSGEAANLEDAYEKACWQNPEIRKLLLNQQKAEQEASQTPKRRADAAAQARDAAKGITGSPTPGARSGGGAKSKMSDREAVEEALRAQGVPV